jgi:hypothetical protein
MKDQTFTIRPADAPRPEGDTRCSRCGQERVIRHVAKWNHLEFLYCVTCMEVEK